MSLPLGDKLPYALRKQAFEGLERHVGHSIVVSRYSDRLGQVFSYAIECEDCWEVLVDVPNPDDDMEDDVCEGT